MPKDKLQGFYIQPDNRLGFSAFEPCGKWMTSTSTQEEAEQIILDILEGRRLRSINDIEVVDAQGIKPCKCEK